MRLPAVRGDPLHGIGNLLGLSVVQKDPPAPQHGGYLAVPHADAHQPVAHGLGKRLGPAFRVLGGQHEALSPFHPFQARFVGKRAGEGDRPGQVQPSHFLAQGPFVRTASDNPHAQRDGSVQQQAHRLEECPYPLFADQAPDVKQLERPANLLPAATRSASATISEVIIEVKKGMT